jgi:hypothetical protein
MTALGLRSFVKSILADGQARVPPTESMPQHSSYLARLRAATNSSAAFEHVLAELAVDKAINTEILICIASQYVGGGRRLRSRKAALTAIRRRHIELIRFQRKQEIARKVTPW